MYNTRQIQCMQAIGLVPWVRRAAATVSSSPYVAKQQSEEQSVAVSGNTDSPLLLIFDFQDGGAWPLGKEDDALLEGMLRAIGMSKASVCSCAILQDTPVPSARQSSVSLQSLCNNPRKRFLYFGGEAIAADAIDPLPMSQVIPGSSIDGWRLPTLAVLREAPQRKKQAWITLKKLRSTLEHN